MGMYCEFEQVVREIYCRAGDPKDQIEEHNLASYSEDVLKKRQVNNTLEHKAFENK